MGFGIKNESEKKRPVKKKVLLIYEGKNTEATYFKELKKQVNSIKLILCGDSAITTAENLEQMINKVCEEEKYYIFQGDEKCYVFDLDVAHKKPGVRKYIVDAVSTNNFKVFYTYPSFEYWILLSFIPTSRIDSTITLDIDAIKTMLENEFHFKFKANKDIPDCRTSELVQKRIYAMHNSKQIAANLPYNLTSEPNIVKFDEICNNTTNKSNLHELMHLVDNFAK
ncbi:MAG: RloB family protein [Mycoplasmatales bacterium]